ncbi:MAG TPA: MFS transporter [Verrucomicrobiae bacterium]
MSRELVLEEVNAEAPRAAAAQPVSISAQRYIWLGLLVVGYIGVYLCRKNFQVAIPILQERFGVSRAEIGLVASYSTIAYAVGKFFFGAIVDRIGGRIGFLGSLTLVALMAVAGGLAPSLGMLTVIYSANRFFGAAAWPAMVKLTPDWFGGKQLPFAVALLSLSFVVGGALATLFAGIIANVSNNNWRLVMALPAIAPFVCVAIGWKLLPRKSHAEKQVQSAPKKGCGGLNLMGVFRRGSFWVICALSFTLTLLRETFNTWTVDLIRTEGDGNVSNQIAAFVSSSFDVMGALGILVVGWIYGRVSARTRQWFLSCMLALLAITLFQLPNLFRLGLTPVMLAIGLVGFLTYGPYSLLGGTLSIEVNGKQSAGTVSGFVDGFGYFAGVLAGAQFGKLVDVGGYGVSFIVLASLALLSSALCFVLFREKSALSADATA